jgi:ABC-type bacteriocin/lantibiotic exporter with double-glycine peptidase domain
MFCISLISGCANKTISFSNVELDKEYKLIKGMKFFNQDPDKCSIAAMKSICDYHKIECNNLDTIFDQSIKGTRLVSLLNYAHNKFEYVFEIASNEEIYKSVSNGIPIILLRNNHYYLVVGYSNDRKYLLSNNGDAGYLKIAPVNSGDDILLILKPRRVSIQSSGTSIRRLL